MVVSKSLTNREWIVQPSDDRLALTIQQRHAVPDIVARVMTIRGVSLDDAADFLNPTLRALLPDPFHLKDMDKAVSRMIAAITNKEKICVFGDYDVDGATSSALLIRFCRAIGVELSYYIPDRMTEGYGPNTAALQKLASDGVKLVITVDCGQTAHEPLAAAKEAGVDVIVLDHHAGEPKLPPAIAVVNPNRIDETSSHRHIAAVGVTFLFLVGLNNKLREQGMATAANLMDELDIVALGTVCDVVSLTGINRAFVRQGLRVMGRSNNIGIKALLNVARNKGMADTYTAGFVLGPRVNAGGRVGKSDLGTRLLSTTDENEAHQLAVQLEQLNEERRAIEADTLEQALNMIPTTKTHAAFVDGDGWHPGVIGLVASRVKDRFNLPAFATAFDGDVGKGSCRSIKGIDIGALIIAARQEGLLVNGGGHAMAAGYTIAKTAYPAFKQFIETRLAKVLAETPLEPTLMLDGLLSLGGVTVELAEKLQQLAPFGAGNPEPRFAMMDVKLLRADLVGANHLRLVFSSEMGGTLSAIAFRAMDHEMGKALIDLKKGSRVNVAGTIRLNTYAMRTDVQLVVEDVSIV
ncbi:MAG: single-stranded-DNA-specific exonuclease RecJ [Alphaproteobacteria bacterium]|nr:single-stranded-DNA-specific exonuclease RecJ [Alphaproteobacteria bacterium]